MPSEVLNLIGGERLGASDGATFERRNPADTRQVVSTAPESTEADVDAAVAAANDGLARWRRTTPTQRANVLGQAARLLAERADGIAAEMVAEEGKPLADARNEASRTPKNLDLYAGAAYRLTGATFPSDDTPLVYSVLDPVGVVAVITPWNFPLNLASRKIGPALAAGNAVVFKPSPMTPLMGDRLAQAFVDAGLPPGVLNVVHGVAAGAHLVAHDDVAAVTFTGSTEVGRKIHDASHLGQRLQLELGGKNPVVVLADADLEAAADVVARSSFSLSGQACTGAGRVLVEDAVHDELLDAGSSEPAATSSDRRPPRCDDGSVDRRVGPSRDGLRRRHGDGGGAGGHRRRPPDQRRPRRRCFFAPTVLADVKAGTAMAREEVFGPVIGFERVGSLDEAIAAANDVDYGLVGGDLHPLAGRRPAVRRRDRGGHGADQPPDRRGCLQRPVRR